MIFLKKIKEYMNVFFNSTYYEDINHNLNLINSILQNINHDSKEESLGMIKYYFDEIIEFIFFDLKALKKNKFEDDYFESINFKMIIFFKELNNKNNSFVLNSSIIEINDFIILSYRNFLIKLKQNQNDYNQILLKNFIDYSYKTLNDFFIYYNLVKEENQREFYKNLIIEILYQYNQKNLIINDEIINNSLFFIKNLDKFEDKINDFNNDKKKIEEIFKYITITLSELSKFTTRIEYIHHDTLKKYTKDFERSLLILKNKIENNYFLFKDLNKMINNYNSKMIRNDFKIIL